MGVLRAGGGFSHGPGAPSRRACPSTMQEHGPAGACAPSASPPVRGGIAPAGTHRPAQRFAGGRSCAAFKGNPMRTTVTIAALGCSLLALAGCKQETTYPAADTATTVIAVPAESSTTIVPVPGPTNTQVVGVPVPGPTVTETAMPTATASPQ